MRSLLPAIVAVFSLSIPNVAFAETPTGRRGKAADAKKVRVQHKVAGVGRASVQIVRGATLKVRNGIAKMRAERRYVRRVDASRRTMFEFE